MRWWWTRFRREEPRPRGMVSLAAPALETMRAEADRGLPSETGGVLVGYRTGSGEVVVTGATGPGPRSFRTRSRFRRDGDHAQTEVDRLHQVSGGRDDYVGEWHSHPEPVGPSGIDVGSMAWIGANAAYQTEEPLLVILQRASRSTWRPLAYRWSGGGLVDLEARVVAANAHD
jgi:integrative and conjugative element protein (TIGR02256 family)